MKTLHFSQPIRATRQRVWDCMLADASYRDWTRAFCEGSYFVGSWDQGASIRFLAPSGDGMYGQIAEARPAEFLAIKLLGDIRQGVIDTDSAAVRQWAPAYETYTFTEQAGLTLLSVTMDCSEEMEPMMVAAWPQALLRLQQLCEAER